MARAVRGVILDESVLLAALGDGSSLLQPDADPLLSRLRHSRIPTGILNEDNASAEKVGLLKKLATTYSLDYFTFNPYSIDDATRDIREAWGETEGHILYVVSETKKEACVRLRSCSWLTTVVKLNSSNKCENWGLHINMLGELPLTICNLIKKESGNDVLKIGYVMKPSREEDFAKRGAFPMYPTQNGLCFVPLIFKLPLASQLQGVDLVLHKATDEIVSFNLNSFSELTERVTFSEGMQELKRYLEHNPQCCVIDPFDKVYPVLDRLEIQNILCGLQDLSMKDSCKIRGPHHLKVDTFNEPELITRLSEAKLSPPFIVKPQVACGVADAHSMAIVFKVEDFKDLKVPVPAIIQEYVDHSSTLYKFYVLGDKVFHAVKKSIPNGDALMKLPETNGRQPLVFDSLKSLPTVTNSQSSGDESIAKTSAGSLNLDLVTDAAKWLSERLDLTIFGFDVVVQDGTRDHVIVDLNYLPSFKEVPDDIAIPAFWHAIRRRYELRRTN
ncbi:inositol 1,3,4-trisphosphate 5/6-kinase 4-like [Syzygium oleosum]|uniref:inositol 1,3,4-trisphosphate 5/6-kinase 4-like n=1 Tax=Syzygium oleosum TaxID=219896 RepID=UPI0024BA7AC1|nr:inositol 1,3,4-trisphosphate 5/6-kinase 4-like [Syzygium oleosum]